MGFPSNNRYWKSFDPGKPKAYKSKELWDVFVKYIEDNETRFWEKADFIKSGPGAGEEVKVKVQNPPSVTGFCAFAAITPQTFNNYRKSGNENFETATHITSIIQTIQVEGATVNLFNANIVARLAGLIDKKEVDIKTDMSEDERNAMIADILKKAQD